MTIKAKTRRTRVAGGVAGYTGQRRMGASQRETGRAMIETARAPG